MGSVTVDEFGRFRDQAPSAQAHPDAARGKYNQTTLLPATTTSDPGPPSSMLIVLDWLF